MENLSVSASTGIEVLKDEIFVFKRDVLGTSSSSYLSVLISDLTARLSATVLAAFNKACIPIDAERGQIVSLEV